MNRFSPRWWQTAAIYQIYPRSFQDSGRDGVEDLPGIIRGLPYLAKLGVDAVWLSPIFRGGELTQYLDAMVKRAARGSLQLRL